MANRAEVREALDEMLLADASESAEMTDMDPDTWGTTEEAQSGMIAAMNLAPGL